MSSHVVDKQDKGTREDSKIQSDGMAAPPSQSNRAQPDKSTPMPKPKPSPELPSSPIVPSESRRTR
ncbi:hypothetical protein DPMN_059278 [Dreissena polymorpha]|uniref:Uncharacterized protein n=1 Tax=Dreissena polymorpha TaxID=45954 RepID=A0A9D4HGF5_DREPO|nr:hypothetical protein DPMN_059278 [Dreissena polymorpha]